MKKHFNFKSVYRAALVALCLLTIGVGNMWGEDFTVYVTGEIFTGTGDNAWDNQKSVIKVDVRYQGNDDDFKDGDVYWNREMTCTDYTYNGYPIYSYTFPHTHSGGQFRFKHYKNGDWKEDYTSDWHSTTEQIYRGYYNDGHQWMVYGRDVTVYTVPEYLFKDYSTKFSEDKHYPSVCVQYGVGVGEWKTIDMVKTDYTYDNYPIWKATFLLDYNIFKEFQIKYFDKANSQQVGLYQYNQGGNTEYPSSDLDDKLYHGWNGSSHDFFPYTYDVKLDQQGGSGGTESIKATDGEVLPAATMPGRDGYIFGGYYTEVGGSGDQYYDTDGLSSTKWNSRTITTLYAKWTAREYTVTLEGMEADSEEPIMVNVTYDAVLRPLETKHTKAHYDLLGYWAANDDHGMNKTEKLIDANGNWIPDVAGYTGNDGEGHPTWIHDGINISLFADWTEHPYTVATSVSPAGAGTLSCGSSVTAKWVTPSELITATANPAWKFVRWEYGENVGPADGTGLNNTVQIKAAVDGTLTAVFEPRFCLVGAKWDNSGNCGMPGWSDYTADFIVNNYTDLSNMNLTCVRSLDPNTTYTFMVYDKVKGKNIGYAASEQYIGDQSLLFNTEDQYAVALRVNGYGPCMFTISALSSGDFYPTVSVAIPASHQLNLEWAYVRINGDWYKTSDAVGGTVNAQTTESGRHFDIHNRDYVAHGGDITYTATPATGYTFEGWYNNDYNTRFSTTNPYTSSNIQTTENVEAKFVEKATAVTLSNDGHGHVEIDGMTVSSTTVGVTTTRELTAVPNEGYKFDSWTIVSGSDITLSSTSTNPTTLTGLGAGAASGQEVRANFIESWIVQPEVGEWGYAYFTIEHIEEVGGKTIGYVDITLAANTNYQFSVVDRDGDVKYKNGSDQVYYMTNGNSHNWGFATDKSFYCGITTAGAGVYRFTWNITDKKMTVTYPNFIIYRTGDRAGDERATENDVESYAGGTIAKAIEFRMRVNRLDKWYTLCLPFTVSAVKVWDEEDGQYYDIVPYYRTGDKYYTGHYIIRTPVSTTDFAIENFDSRDRWVDPSSAVGYLPSANTPYIIQWHDSWFQNKYISFFGPTGESIPTSMNQGANTSSDETVNIYGNDCMTSGTVRDAYMLDSDYGSGGAWLRAEVGTDRTVLPFECFIRANATTTAKYRVLRRDMADDTPTGLDTLSKTEDTVSKVLINNRIYIIRGGKMYTIQGTFVKEVE